MSTEKKSTKDKSKPKSAKPATRPLNTASGHVEGSRKSKVHQLFDTQGAEAAWVLGLKLKLKEGTLRSWFAAWKRVQRNGKEKVENNSNATPAVKPDGLTAPSEAAHL